MLNFWKGSSVHDFLAAIRGWVIRPPGKIEKEQEKKMQVKTGEIGRKKERRKRRELARRIGHE